MMPFVVELGRPYISALNVFGYVSARAIFAALTAFVIGCWMAPRFIAKMRAMGGGQPIQDDGPQWHADGKRGTPTMGGVFLLVALFSSALLWGDWRSEQLWLALAVTAAFAIIGGADDYLKIKHGCNNNGLSVVGKLSSQSLAAVLALLAIWQLDAVDGHYGLLIPYFKDTVLAIGVIGFVVVGFLAIVGASNAVNLTDGLDGLAILPAVLVAGGLSVYAYAAGHSVFSEYLGLPYVVGVHELVIFCAALVGAGLSFLWYNAHPAHIFMGDVGSLPVGAALATVAVLTRQEVVFVIMSGLFVAEALSVIFQVGYFKSFGRRLFLMAPFHHHFEMKGWNENQVVVRFWIITLVLVLVGLTGLKIR